MHMIIAVLGAVFAIAIIIILHELGHFLVAKAFGIKILRFSLGFGKPLYKYVGKKSGTEYVLGILPLGGYVKMLDSSTVSDPEEAKSAYDKQPLLARMAVVAAGPVANFIIALVAYWAVFMIGVVHIKPVVGRVIPQSIASDAGLKRGDELLAIDNERVHNWQQVLMALVVHVGDEENVTLKIKAAKTAVIENRVLDLSDLSLNERDPDLFSSLGVFPFVPPIKPIVGEVISGGPANQSDMTKGDIILSINGQKVDHWMQLVEAIRKIPGQSAVLEVKKDSVVRTVTLRVGTQKQGSKKTGYLGIMVKSPEIPADMLKTQQFSVFTAWLPAAAKTWQLFRFNVISVGKLITGKVSVKTLGGPITIFQAAGRASQAGIQVYLGFIAFISLTIGFINLLPIPGLDGGHLLFQVIEGIIRRPLSVRLQTIGFMVGMGCLILLMLQATVNDLLRFFT